MAVLIGADIGNWVGGHFGGFVCVLLAIPVAAAIQVVIREIWDITAMTRAEEETRTAAAGTPAPVTAADGSAS